MFFKRISDVYREEYGEALADSGGDHEFAAFAENHGFQIPEGCLWSDVRDRTENVGQALTTAMREIEKSNPDTLYGIFGGAAWTNKSKRPDRTLTDLIEHFSGAPFTNASVPPDMFGQPYEYLIKRFADQSNKKAGGRYTPRSVVRLMVNMLDPQEGETVYDPAFGTGGVLVEHVNADGGRPQLLWGKLCGQEKALNCLTQRCPVTPRGHARLVTVTSIDRTLASLRSVAYVGLPLPLSSRLTSAAGTPAAAASSRWLRASSLRRAAKSCPREKDASCALRKCAPAAAANSSSGGSTASSARRDAASSA